MSRRLIRIAIILIVVLVAAQLIRPDQTNPPTDPARTIQAQMTKAPQLAAVLDRACNDCHSNDVVWPRFAQFAPLSWLMTYAVIEGRKAVNYSEWASYRPELQRALLSASCRDASTGKMPGAYTLVRPDTRLSPSDVETICAAARQLEAHRAGASQ